MKDWDISEQCWKGKYWKIYTRLEVSGGKQSAEGANFIFPDIHHLKRHLLWAERHITNLLPIPPRKHFKRISFSKNKVNKNSVAIRTPIQNAFYMHNSWFVYVSKKVTKTTGALKKKTNHNSQPSSPIALSEASAISFSIHLLVGWSIFQFTITFTTQVLQRACTD